jgi:hypothetical protein
MGLRSEAVVADALLDRQVLMAHQERPIYEFHGNSFRLGLRGICSLPYRQDVLRVLCECFLALICKTVSAFPSPPWSSSKRGWMGMVTQHSAAGTLDAAYLRVRSMRGSREPSGMWR